jgi:tetratricopeptide (TPR) repeat protein
MSGGVAAAPQLPADDSLIVLRVAASPEQEELRALERAVESSPADPIALQTLVDAYLQLGRRTAEPRYFGRAEALLAAKLDEAQPPAAVALRMADIWQYRHEYQKALALIERVLAVHPFETQALLMRAAIRQTQGQFDLAHADCRTLLAHGEATLGATCLAQTLSMTGSLTKAQRLLASLVERSADLPASQRVWMLTALADMEERLGRVDRGESLLRQALALDAYAHYARLALADLLLDNNRAAEIAALLAPMPQTEGAMLRLAEARRRLAPAGREGDQLQVRFEEAARRGERLHRRDLARLHMSVLDDRGGALRWALENWSEQREPADARLLARAALAVNDQATLVRLRSWREQTGYEDRQLDRILARGNS